MCPRCGDEGYIWRCDCYRALTCCGRCRLIYYNCPGCHHWREVVFYGKEHNREQTHTGGHDSWCRECGKKLEADGNILEDM